MFLLRAIVIRPWIPLVGTAVQVEDNVIIFC